MALQALTQARDLHVYDGSLSCKYYLIHFSFICWTLFSIVGCSVGTHKWPRHRLHRSLCGAHDGLGRWLISILLSTSFLVPSLRNLLRCRVCRCSFWGQSIGAVCLRRGSAWGAFGCYLSSPPLLSWFGWGCMVVMRMRWAGWSRIANC